MNKDGHDEAMKIAGATITACVFCFVLGGFVASRPEKELSQPQQVEEIYFYDAGHFGDGGIPTYDALVTVAEEGADHTWRWGDGGEIRFVPPGGDCTCPVKNPIMLIGACFYGKEHREEQ